MEAADNRCSKNFLQHSTKETGSRDKGWGALVQKVGCQLAELGKEGEYEETGSFLAA